MKGIILSGGAGTRLYPLTRVTSKQLLPVYDQPMIYYPLQTLISAGIKEILIIVAPDHAGDYLKLLGSGKDFGVRFTYEIQDKPEGLAQAFIIGEQFIGDDSVALILGDNIFVEDDFSEVLSNFKNGGHIFAKQVPDPERFGVVEFDDKMNVKSVVEKPSKPASDYAGVGLYVFDNRVVRIARELKPSARGELEIVDVDNWYLQRGELKVSIVKGPWVDAGTIESLHLASTLIREKKINKK